MKKLLLVLAIGAFAACGDNSTDDTTTTDTVTTSTVDTNTTVAPIPDTTAVSSDTSVVRPDSAATKK
jgi:hypothetical protein